MPNATLFRVVLVLVMFITGCTADSPSGLPIHATLVSSQDMPRFDDDLKLEGLSIAVQNQLKVLRREDNTDGVEIGGIRYDTAHLLESLEQFNQLLSEAQSCLDTVGDDSRCYATLAENIQNHYLVYRLNAALLTGYYTPTIEVSTLRTERYKYPIYRTPTKESERHLSRDAIDFGHELDGKGYVLYYAADRFDLYILHIEGGAKVVVHDNGNTYTKYLDYSADNGREFRHLDNYMVDHDMISPNHLSRLDQRNYLNKHPNQARNIYASCPGYVFFKVSDTPPVTSTGISLTENRSLASDPTYYPVKGLIAYVVAPIPQPPKEGTSTESNPDGLKYRTMRQFFIDQDEGHFISGPARADLFFGEGPYAEFLSNNFMTRGQIYFLISK